MADIYIVNHTTSGMYPWIWSSYHHTETEAQDAFDDCLSSVTEDPSLITIIRLDTETLEATTLRGWEVTADDLDEDSPDAVEDDLAE